MDWCDNVDHHWKTQLVLLTAVAGAGKSAVAHTIAHLCDQRGILLSSFFFSEGNTTSPEFLWSGVARSLAIKSKSYRQTLTSILENDPTIATAAFDAQFRKLILEPLRHGSPLANSPLIIVIDALDECDEDTSPTLSKLLRDNVPELPRCIKFFVTSRPVRLVDNYFHSSSSIHRMRIELSDDKNLQDCAAYIRSQVWELKALRATVSNWRPDFEEKLVTHAGGLFVWVSVVMEYLKNKSTDPVAMLKGLLDLDASREKVLAEKNMDALYSAILSKCNWEDPTFEHDYPIIMGAIVTARSPLSITAWATLLSPFLRTSLENTISKLRPLLSGMDQPFTPIQLLHQSLRDYLNRHDDNEAWTKLEPAANQERLALRCFQVTNVEVRNVAGLGIIEELGELEVMPTIPQTNIPEHLAYACRYGLDHILHVQRVSGELETDIEKFLGESITLWLELCVRAEGYISIYPFFCWIEVSHGNAC